MEKNIKKIKYFLIDQEDQKLDKKSNSVIVFLSKKETFEIKKDLTILLVSNHDSPLEYYVTITNLIHHSSDRNSDIDGYILKFKNLIDKQRLEKQKKFIKNLQ